MAHAAATISFVESGSDVVASGSGSILLSGSTANTNYAPAVMASIGAFTLGTGGLVTDYVMGLTGPNSFGTGSIFFANAATGSTFGVVASQGRITVPSGYVSGSPLSGTATWTNQTFASLGLTPGTYNYSWGSGQNADSLTVEIGVTPVPEPATALLSLAGLVGVAACVKRRRAS